MTAPSRERAVGDRIDGARRQQSPERSERGGQARAVALPSGRALLGGLLVALAAVLAFLAARGDDSSSRIPVVVAETPMTRGHVIGPNDVRLVPIDADGAVGGLYGSIEAVAGRQITGTIEAGEFVLASNTTEAVAEDVLEVTVAVTADRTPSNLGSGDRIDVFATWGSGRTELIAVDAEVLAVDSAGDDLLVDGESRRLRLAVAELDQLEAVVHANVAGEVSVVRAAIGSETGDVGRIFDPDLPRPIASGSEGDGDGTGDGDG